MPETLADRLAAFTLSTRFEDLPNEVVVEARRRLLDAFACAAGALDEPAPEIARKAARAVRSEPGSGLFGGGRSSPDWAAFANGVHIRYLDCNDTYLSLEPAHPSDNWAAIMAVGEHAGADGRAWITAAAVAYEVQCRLADACSIRARGWDHVTYGALSTSLAASKLLGLDHSKTVHALGIAGTTSAALRLTRAGELSMWKGCAFAHAARNGVFAAILAREGMTGPSPLFEGDMGFWQQVSGPFEVAQLGGPAGLGLDTAEDVDQVRASRVSQPVGHRRRVRARGRGSATRLGFKLDPEEIATFRRWPSRKSLVRTPRSGGPRLGRPPTTACRIARRWRWSTAKSRPTSSPRLAWPIPRCWTSFRGPPWWKTRR